MHEISVLENTIRACKDVAKENNVSHIHSITLEVGELTGYIPKFFTEYFPIVTDGDPLFEGAKLNLLIVPGEALCNECHAMYNVMKQEGKCPKCSSRSKTIIGGQEFKLKDIIAE